MSFIIPMIILLLIQVGINIMLSILGVPTIVISIVIDLVLAIIFSVFNYRGREKLRNPEFHRSVAIYFVMLTIISLLFGGYNG